MLFAAAAKGVGLKLTIRRANDILFSQFLEYAHARYSGSSKRLKSDLMAGDMRGCERMNG
jgi:hypothetical protein